MDLRPATHWLAGDRALDPRLLPLLRGIARTGSLNRAVAALHMSYRHAWGLLGKAEHALGQRLVVLRRGHGAHLSAVGEKLVDTDDAAAELLERGLAEQLQAFNRSIPAAARSKRERPLVIHASHDLALAELRDLLPSGSAAPAVDLQFRGSLDSLDDLAHGRCDVAGFHVPAAPLNAHALDPYRSLLKARSLRLIRFVTRRQGLIVPTGNPGRIRALSDIADGKTRFINRQQGSGTRFYLEQLLAAQRISPARIAGYQREEFTHAAVAATVASGMADAGFGIEAAARLQGLDFVPLATERYFLASRANTLAGASMQRLLEAIKGPAFGKCLERLAGYDAQGIGEVVTPRDALRDVDRIGSADFSRRAQERD
jgi:molybdate transport repressor ModE-like protein